MLFSVSLFKVHRRLKFLSESWLITNVTPVEMYINTKRNLKRHVNENIVTMCFGIVLRSVENQRF